MTLLGWDLETFLKAKPRLWLKHYITYLEINHPEAINKEEEIKTLRLDQSPYW